MSILEVNKDNWSEVSDSKLPILVDFWATWCGPCKTMLPILEELSKEYSDKIKIVKVDIEESMDLAKQYGIKSVPTMIVFVNGEKTNTKIIGAINKQNLVKKLEEYLG
jgi:thioredoxin 1